MFSKACEYGIKAMIYISRKSLEGERVNIPSIAQHINSPKAFTGKILGTLSQHNLVQSITGPNGGFEIDAKKLKKLSLLHIVEAIDGDALFHQCALGLRKCSNKRPCPMHYTFLPIRNQLYEVLKKTTLLELAQSLQSGETILKV